MEESQGMTQKGTQTPGGGPSIRDAIDDGVVRLVLKNEQFHKYLTISKDLTMILYEQWEHPCVKYILKLAGKFASTIGRARRLQPIVSLGFRSIAFVFGKLQKSRLSRRPGHSETLTKETESIIENIEVPLMQDDSSDMLFWKHTKNGQCTSKSAHKEFYKGETQNLRQGIFREPSQVNYLAEAMINTFSQVASQSDLQVIEYPMENIRRADNFPDGIRCYIDAA
uniref:Uncharacterized protein n=2 Tax=Oryza sativa subsp. japonica TaxID=39947 RepID=Q53LL0_ORYSJ|nr:hypothetical protein LOC_Os11g09810 [Oryza sativa Japonica Group]ABA91971.1 hypothetical protein LOC_Os11g09810 [Oryza sativa Japonica Group]